MADGDSLKKIRISNELIYVLAVVILSFATAMLAAADMGMSMVVAPAYIVSLKVEYLTFGQAEYIVQGMLFVLFCILMRRVKVLSNTLSLHDALPIWTFLRGGT